MSILETFYILFKADASGVKKGTEEAKRTTDELNETLRGTATAGERVGEIFFSIAEQFGKVAASALSVYAVVDGLKKASDYTSGLDVASRTLGVNIEQLDEWGNALRMTGGDAKSFQAALQAFSQHTGATPAIAIQFFPRLAEMLKQLNQVQAFQFGHAIGLDDPLIALFRQYGASVAQLIQHEKDLGVVTDKDRAIQNAFNNAWFETQHIFRNLFVDTDNKLLPVLTRLFKVIEPGLLFLQQHTNLLIGAFAGLAVGVGIAAATLIAAFSEFLIVPAIFAGIGVSIALLYDEFQKFKVGQSEVYNDMVKRWPFLGELIKGIIFTNTEVFKGLGYIGRWAFENILLTAQWLRKELYMILDAIQEIYGFFRGTGKELNGNNLFTLQQKGQQALTLAQGFSLPSSPFGSIFNSSNTQAPQTVTTGDITINTLASDAQAVYTTVRDLFTKLTHGATSLFDNGIAK